MNTDRTVNHSSIKYLQRLVAQKCAALPSEFATRAQWEDFKTMLIPALTRHLPVVKPTRLRPDAVTARLNLGDHAVLEEVDVCVDDDYFVQIHLYRPVQHPAPLPCVLVCPGYMQEKRAEDIADMCISLTRQGIAAAAVEYSGTGSCAERPDSQTDIDNAAALSIILGRNDIGLRVTHNLAVLRHLKNRPDIDPNRVGITGLCQGSIVLWYTAALCEDFKAIAPLCGTTTLEAEALEYTSRQGGWSGASPFVFDLLSHCDVQHLYGCFAPRPLLVQNNITDRHWPYSGLQKVKDMTEHIYALYGASRNASFRLEHENHAFCGAFINNIARWFAEQL